MARKTKRSGGTPGDGHPGRRARPVSSASSRRAAPTSAVAGMPPAASRRMQRSASGSAPSSPSPGSTAPPGKTYFDGMKAAPAPRWPIRTSGPPPDRAPQDHRCGRADRLGGVRPAAKAMHPLGPLQRDKGALQPRQQEQRQATVPTEKIVAVISGSGRNW
jgi:hypothetical protein